MNDIHGICESYIKTDLGEINTTATADGFTDNPNSYKQFTVEIGEEWFVGSTLNSNPNQETRTVITFNGSLPNYRGNTVNFYDWTAVATPNNYSTPFSTHWAARNDSDFEIASPTCLIPSP